MKRFIRDDSGQDLVEYVLIVALIAFGCVAGMNTLATDISSAFGTISNNLGTAVNSTTGGHANSGTGQ